MKIAPGAAEAEQGEGKAEPGESLPAIATRPVGAR